MHHITTILSDICDKVSYGMSTGVTPIPLYASFVVGTLNEANELCTDDRRKKIHLPFVWQLLNIMYDFTDESLAYEYSVPNLRVAFSFKKQNGVYQNAAQKSTIDSLPNINDVIMSFVYDFMQNLGKDKRIHPISGTKPFFWTSETARYDISSGNHKLFKAADIVLCTIKELRIKQQINC